MPDLNDTKEKLREPSLRLYGSHYETLLMRHPNVLGKKRRFVLCKRYGINGLGPATKKEIASELSLTSERIRQIVSESIAMLEEAEFEVSSRVESIPTPQRLMLCSCGVPACDTFEEATIER